MKLLIIIFLFTIIFSGAVFSICTEAKRIACVSAAAGCGASCVCDIPVCECCPVCLACVVGTVSGCCDCLFPNWSGCTSPDLWARHLNKTLSNMY